MAYKSLADILKPQEEEPIMSEMSSIQKNRLADIPPAQPESQVPMIPNETPQEQVFTEPKLEDILPVKSETPMLAEAETPQPSSEVPATPMSKSEALLAEYNKLMGKEQESLAEARKRDRMLKIGGSIGDALATYLNARSQMNVKAPGVQVQQGAGLGKVADMFATAPEIASDIAQRRQALMDQYKQLAAGEESAADRALKERQIAAYEAQTRAQARKAEAEAAKERTEKKEKPTIGEQTVDREFAKKYNEWRTGGKADYEENKKIFDEAITALEKGNVSTGAASGIGSRLPGVRTATRELETRVRKAVNGMLRATLGAQFTEEEGKRIFEQTFDPFASPEENVKNMQTELNRIEKRAKDIEQQGQYFTKQKTLSGFEAPTTVMQEQALSPRDQQALDWANNNPNDPRAAQIKRRVGR